MLWCLNCSIFYFWIKNPAASNSLTFDPGRKAGLFKEYFFTVIILIPALDLNFTYSTLQQYLINFLFFNIFRQKRDTMFRIEEKKEGDIIILQTFGEMLDEDARMLPEKVKGLVTGGIHKIVIDLSKINLMNSCFGLGVLAACWGYMNRENGKLVLANPSTKVKRILEITKLNKVFDIFSTVDEAVHYFK
jgi:anti-sigma B factor antagonist